MFPSFKNISDRQEKHRALLAKANRDIQIENAKQDAYKQTLWASDADKNIALSTPRTTDNMALDLPIATLVITQPTPSATSPAPPAPPARPIMTTSGTQVNISSKYQQMLEEDLRSHILNHNDRIVRLYNEANSMFQTLANHSNN